MSAAATPPARRWPGQNAIWRWHFYASLFCIPFVLWLSLTGSIYLFRPQIEAWIDRPYAQVATTGARASAAAQADAALRAVPGSRLEGYELPATAEQAVQIVVVAPRGSVRVYVHPQTLAVLRIVDDDDRPMRIVFRLHGELLAGPVGSYVVELAASWTIVMILTGLALWWPRGGGLAGVVYPLLRAGRRRFWRDIHGVTGFWVSLAALFLLLSGLPWAQGWGGYLTMVRRVAEGAPPRQDWSTEHGDHHMAGQAHASAPGTEPLDRLIATVRPLALAPPVLIAPPAAAGAPWSAKSEAADRPMRTDLTLSGKTGAMLTRRDFAQRRLVDRIVGWGVAIHEGQAFGGLNQLLNLLTAAGLTLLSVSGAILWWRRRPAGRLGAPPLRPAMPLVRGFAVLLVALGVALPLFGLSLAVVLLVDRLAIGRAPALRQWLGSGRRERHRA